MSAEILLIAKKVNKLKKHQNDYENFVRVAVDVMSQAGLNEHTRSNHS